MGLQFKFYKRRFRNVLQPLFVMLIARKAEMDNDRWRQYVVETMRRVIGNPNEFLGADLPHEALTSDIVTDLFEEFLKVKGR
jgi:hypothetical protein